MLAIFKREIGSYLRTPIGYIFPSLFLILSGVLFSLSNLFGLSPRYAPFLTSILFLYVLVIPVLTMRLMTDELRFKTDQLLLTTPVSITSIVLGKYFAAISVLFVTIAITVIYPIVISFYGDIDGWESFGSYIGFLLLGCTFVSIGLFISATTENQVVAAIVTFVALLISWIMDFLQRAIPSDPAISFIFVCVVVAAVVFWIYLSTRNLIIPIAIGILGFGAAIVVFIANQEAYLGFISKTLDWVSFVRRFASFTRGLLVFDSIVYYLTVSALFVFLTVRLIEKRRWS